MSYQIKEVMKKTNLTEKAIRLYIDRGLISPINKVDFGKNHYYFEEEQIQALKEIALLRAFRFSLQDISYIFYNDSGLKEILHKHEHMMDAEKYIQEIWNYDPDKKCNIRSKSDLIEYLSVSKRNFEQDRLYGNLFQNLEDEFIPQDSEYPPKLCYLVVVLIFVAGTMIGGFFIKHHVSAVQNAEQEASEFSYGIEEQSLSVKNVNWQEYPDFRTVDFNIAGSFTVIVPKGSHCILQDLPAESELIELQRENFCISDGKNLTFYDKVKYELLETTVRSSGLLKKEEKLLDAVQGYCITMCIGDYREVLGYIPPLCESYYEWSAVENQYSQYNYDRYLSNFSLSRTYTERYNMSTIQSDSDIYLYKEEGGILNCTIDNTNGIDDWTFKSIIPTIELWYHGVWIAVNSPFDDNLAFDVCPAGEKREIIIPTKTINEFSYFFPGIYRLVVWGTDNNFIISESFTIGESR